MKPFNHIRSLVVLMLTIFALLVPGARAQNDDDEGKPKPDDNGPKHYLYFQIGVRGSAEKSHQEVDGHSETQVEVSNLFSGRIEVRPEESADIPTGQSEAAMQAQYNAMMAAVMAGDVEKAKAAAPPTVLAWYPVGDQVEITGKISETITFHGTALAVGEQRASTDEMTDSYRCQKVFSGSFGNAFVKIRAAEKRYDVQFMLNPDMATTMEAVKHTKVFSHQEEGNNQSGESEQAVPLDMGPGQEVLGYSNYQMFAEAKGLSLPGDAKELTGRTRIPVPKPDGWNGSWDIALEASWQIDVALPPVELVITVPGYDHWRPEGNIKEPTKPGNNLTARATLIPKEGAGKFVPRVTKIRFQLLDSSREPGVCMNWPLEAKDSDYDLRLALVAGGKLSKNDLIMELEEPSKDDQEHPYAEVQIDSYDFGGRASLRAICTLLDGREIEGVMKNVGEMPRLPKMAKPGWIADSWRKAQQVEKLPDYDDEEKVENQKDKGDGYTLYEEYRGWVEDGKRIEGDPKGKDFFVLNLIKGDGEKGIALFEAVSGLRVHSKLLPTEMSEKKRLMNGNHRDGPHRVDQHGVWVKTMTRSELGETGAVTAFTEKGVAGRPGITTGVALLARDNTESVFSQPFNLPVQDTVFAFDRAIAHELLHSVGVEHHGPDDTEGYSLAFVPPNVPDNKIGRPHYRMSGGTVVNFLEENGDNVAVEAYRTYLQAKQLLEASGLRDLITSLYGKSFKDKPAGSPAFEQFVDEYVDLLLRLPFTVKGMVGRDHGVHSGDQDCLMRYYFARFYDGKNTPEKTVYFVTPGTERIGMEICREGKGTGLNAPDHKPQSRYGDANLPDGGCYAQICPNDAIPPRKVK